MVVLSFLSYRCNNKLCLMYAIFFFFYPLASYCFGKNKNRLVCFPGALFK